MLSVMEIIGYLSYALYLILPYYKIYDATILLLLSLSLVITLSFNDTLLNQLFAKTGKMASQLGKLSIYIFLSHYFLAKTVFGSALLQKGFTKGQLVIPYLIVVVLLGLGLQIAHDFWKKRKKHFFRFDTSNE